MPAQGVSQRGRRSVPVASHSLVCPTFERGHCKRTLLQRFDVVARFFHVIRRFFGDVTRLAGFSAAGGCVFWRSYSSISKRRHSKWNRVVRVLPLVAPFLNPALCGCRTWWRFLASAKRGCTKRCGLANFRLLSKSVGLRLGGLPMSGHGLTVSLRRRGNIMQGTAIFFLDHNEELRHV